jgi:hypothetical protein
MPLNLNNSIFVVTMGWAPWVFSWQGTIFSLCFNVQAWSVYQPLSYPMRRCGTFSRGKMTTDLELVSGIRMCGSVHILPFPFVSSCHWACNLYTLPVCWEKLILTKLSYTESLQHHSLTFQESQNAWNVWNICHCNRNILFSQSIDMALISLKNGNMLNYLLKWKPRKMLIAA